MASRRDELNAYTFARKRMVGAFLQPGGGGNDEDAPRPLRAVLPSFVVAAVVVAGFGMWGVLKPAAPPNWDNGKYILQGKSSTTRYVILNDGKDKKPTLHQVLNMSSARLVLPAGATVLSVADDVLDKYPSRGATIGIPYAPDKLPSKDDAGRQKLWSVCDTQGKDKTQSSVGQSVFVAAGDEEKKLKEPALVLNEEQVLFVQQPPVDAKTDGSLYLVDSTGMKHAIGTYNQTSEQVKSLKLALFGQIPLPQQVTQAWLDTLGNGSPVQFPVIPGMGDKGAAGSSRLDMSDPKQKRIGHLLSFQDAFYVVGADQLYQITPFQYQLMRSDPAVAMAYGDGTEEVKAEPINASDINKLQPKIDSHLMTERPDMPTHEVKAVNAGEKPRTVVCSTYAGAEADGRIKRTVWADVQYPGNVTADLLSAHVTAGHGLLYRAVDGDTLDTSGQASSGSYFLITDAGLRYSLPASTAAPAADGSSAAPAAPAAKSDTNEAQARLDYKDVVPPQVPAAWSKLVPAGPVLDTMAAVQPQNA
ncbi:type VII secretion protein EccB [Kitasatospora sp. SolWspMP-SS2h]|uniref:type VII secretion protein EccB n=1 Tax=Kitasatospora sp. SolWspMP-SS2h TaxID=1305729 RepID=UPI000DBF61BB|nr:type VII secretion protein EccB [Kitasatospora sp. SolWspMP-SS2h]RAJ32286.1 type VII secretion protein EccB [Kitasatospora sp. SolWspMP-SS2h]